MKKAVCTGQTAIERVLIQERQFLISQTTERPAAMSTESTLSTDNANSPRDESDSKLREDLPGSRSFGRLTELIATIRSQSPDCIAAVPGNVCLVNLSNASEIAAQWIKRRDRISTLTTAEIEVPSKLLQRAAETFTSPRQWAFLFAILNRMQSNKSGIAFLHSEVIQDVVGGWRFAQPVHRLLKDKTLFRRVIEPAKGVTASGYILTQAPDFKSPSILSNLQTTDFSKSLVPQPVSPTKLGEHRMGLGWGLGDMRVVNSNGLERLKLVGRYRVNSVRLIVDLDETWDRVRESMSRRWGHLDAAADGAGRLDQVSEAEAIEIATRHLKPEDDDATRAGQIAAAVDFARYVAMDRDSQIRATKWRGGRIFVPGLSLRKEARQELFRFSGEQLVKCDARCAYWWILCAEIRRALLLTRETQTLSDQIKTTRRIENIERLLCLASSGQFYKFFADRCGIDVDLVKSRINMLCLFNDNNLGGPEFRLLEREWPEVAEVIRRIRAQSGFTSTLSRFLNGLEGQLFNEPLKALSKVGHAVVRYHDCLAVPRSSVADAIAAIRFRAEERFGIVPGIKAEYPDGHTVCFNGEIAADSAGVSDRYWKLAQPTEQSLTELANLVCQQIVAVDLSKMAI